MAPPKQKIDPLQKKIPKNPRYANVLPTIDSGASISSYLRKVEDIRQNYRIRKDELFKRMKITTYVQLIVQVAEINFMTEYNIDNSHPDYDSEEETPRIKNGNSTNRTTHDQGVDTSDAPTVPQLPVSDFHSVPYSPIPSTARSTLKGVISGVGEFELTHPGSVQRPLETAGFHDALPYLLLDVREREDYDRCHIIKAHSYPYQMISRSVNFETKEMLSCRNQPGKIIVLYDEDERIAPRVATTLVERGYDNLFLLSGGLKVANQIFPAGLITGSLPASLRPAPAKRSRGSKQPPRNAVVPPGGAGGDSSFRSQSSVLSVPVSVVSDASTVRPADQLDFTLEDVCQLNQQLEAKANDGASSRFSGSRCSGSVASSRMTTAQSVMSDVKPFK